MGHQARFLLDKPFGAEQRERIRQVFLQTKLRRREGKGNAQQLRKVQNRQRFV